MIETPGGDSVTIRHMLYLSMSFEYHIVKLSLTATILTAVTMEQEKLNSDGGY